MELNGKRDAAPNVQRSRFYRLGSFAYRRRIWVLIAWVGILVAVGPALGKISDNLSQGGFEVPGSQSDFVAKAVENDFSAYELTDLLVMKSDRLVATDPQFRSTFAKVRAALLEAPGVEAVSDPYAAPERSISADGRVLTAVVGITDDQDQALAHNDEVEEAVAEASKGSGITTLVTGAPPFYAAFEETTTSDLERAERIALPITLIILVIAFGSVVAAGVPLVMALVGLGAAFGIISIIATQTTVSTFAQNTASMVGIGVGIDYSLFILTRFREHLRNDRAVSQAIAEAMASSGKAVFVSALTVVVALAGTQLVNVAAFRSMGFAPMIAVALAGAAALTLLPAFLGLLGRRVNKWAIKRKRSVEGAVWHRWAMTVMRRPWTALLVSVVILGVLAAPALGLRMGSSGPSILPPDAGPRVAAQITADAFGEGQVAPLQIVIDHPRGVLGAGFADIYAAVQRIARDEEVARIDSVATLVPGAPVQQAQGVANSPQAQQFVKTLVARDGTRTIVYVVTKHGPQSDPVDALVERLRDQLPGTLPAGVVARVGGDGALNTDINNEMQNKLIPVVGLVMLLSFLVLMLFFRSILLPLKAILMNTASVLATYGVLVFIFQQGHFEGLLGFESTGNIDSFLPLFLFCILFGLSMDYEVFMLARIREEYLRTHDNTEAVGWGLEHTARIITSAALVMVTVFGAFAFASLAPIKAMGFGLATAVFLDATLIRVVLVPATMRLMGDWNWWLPKWLDRILPKVSIEEELEYIEPLPEPAGASR
ncbi:MAG TPA: MMPL family transporter [Actinomycetota bacterium]|nr:MMPL family transporter [Actinomycetota bacterium]